MWRASQYGVVAAREGLALATARSWMRPTARLAGKCSTGAAKIKGFSRLVDRFDTMYTTEAPICRRSSSLASPCERRTRTERCDVVSL